ncbi:glycosyltransferase [Mesorhizobium sp.]|uniref:glycosyltransferase n=1 Tax=Mesorhizobium sp. TaxID=1871066 RepID=UPI00257FED72|nr:glycosyltransferase [Mesorhizobium sp.]
MKVGVLTASISRRAGGLFWSVRSLATGTRGAGCEVDVFAVEDPFSQEDAAQWRDVPLAIHAARGPQAFGFAPGLGVSLDSAGLDVVHTHGLWMYPSVAASQWATRWKKPLVISPRGMLDPWAVRNSSWKKRLAGWLFENRHLRQAACLHALNEAEYEAMRAYGLVNPVAVIPNGVDLANTGERLAAPKWAADLEDERVMLFLGRLHPKKGIAGLLHAWARVQKDSSPSVERWRLVIAGWDQSGHEAELRQLAGKLKLDENVRFVGPQFDAEKAASLTRADAFVLPSFSEGLPMAVLEAWASSLPVLMTQQCNLPEGFAAGAAFEIAPDADSMVDALAAFFDLPQEDRLAMGERGRRLVEERFDWESIAVEMASVYAWILGRAPKPACVRMD